jgi:hypothetical protein
MVANRTAPGSQALLGLAATNAVGQVMPDGLSRSMMESLPGVNTSIGSPGSAVAEAGADRSQAGQPSDPVMQTAAQAGIGINDALDKSVAYGEAKVSEVFGPSQSPTSGTAPTNGDAGVNAPSGDGDVLSGTWALGESTVGSLLGTQSKSGQLPIRDSGTAGGDTGGSGETPPPSNR